MGSHAHTHGEGNAPRGVLAILRSPSAPSSLAVRMATTLVTGPELYGQMKKLSPSLFKGWQKRWFVLQSGNLFYYKSHGDWLMGKMYLGVITTSQIVDINDEDLRTGFRIRTAQGRTVTLRCKTQFEREHWVGALGIMANPNTIRVVVYTNGGHRKWCVCSPARIEDVMGFARKRLGIPHPAILYDIDGTQVTTLEQCAPFRVLYVSEGEPFQTPEFVSTIFQSYQQSCQEMECTLQELANRNDPTGETTLDQRQTQERARVQSLDNLVLHQHRPSSAIELPPQLLMGDQSVPPPPPPLATAPLHSSTNSLGIDRPPLPMRPPIPPRGRTSEAPHPEARLNAANAAVGGAFSVFVPGSARMSDILSDAMHYRRERTWSGSDEEQEEEEEDEEGW